MILFRPVGLKELGLIFDAGMKAFPPRLPEQPIFYPVTNFEYADQIASRWNTKRRDLVGYVTTFSVEDDYSSQFETHIVGGRIHEELWVPAEQLDEFNKHIEGFIQVDAAHFGSGFVGEIPKSANLKGKNAAEQFVYLWNVADYNAMDFHLEIIHQKRVVYVHYPFWCEYDFRSSGISAEDKAELLHRIKKAWEMANIPFTLPRLSGRNIP